MGLGSLGTLIAEPAEPYRSISVDDWTGCPTQQTIPAEESSPSSSSAKPPKKHHLHGRHVVHEDPQVALRTTMSQTVAHLGKSTLELRESTPATPGACASDEWPPGGRSEQPKELKLQMKEDMVNLVEGHDGVLISIEGADGTTAYSNNQAAVAKLKSCSSLKVVKEPQDTMIVERLEGCTCAPTSCR